jgi:hypothetical protein
MSSAPDERRAFRTREAREAARRFLESLARRNHLSALALASENGALVTGVGDGCDLDWLASQAAILAIGGEAASRSVSADAARRLRCFTMTIGPYVLHVGAFGAFGAPRDAALPVDECDAGLRRIYEPLFCCAA